MATRESAENPFLQGNFGPWRLEATHPLSRSSASCRATCTARITATVRIRPTSPRGDITGSTGTA
jgi:hypothetical protein